MCGIAGYLCGRAGAGIGASDPGPLRAMTDAIAHRGPDDAGSWRDPEHGVALGHRRLAILDLTPTGHQPMVSHDGRYVLVFNGEIYNFAELRRRLESTAKVEWCGTSDTEVLLECIARWGLRAALDAQDGMFALAAWDRQERRLHLARDRFGEKPLYYARVGSCFVFGSELKALRAFPGFSPAIDRSALAAYLQLNYIPAPATILENVFKLPPAHGLTVAMDAGDAIETWSYWDADSVAAAALRNPLPADAAANAAELGRLLGDAVERRSLADVPVGAFLSGGIDSSLVVSLMQERASRPVRTFSIGFNEPQYDEAPFARAVARHVGTDHTELCVTPEMLQGVIPLLPRLYDEPFADSSQMPTYLVAKLAGEHVKVVLSGDAGDEFFGGYDRYEAARQLWMAAGWLPHPVRSVVAGLGRLPGPQFWETVLQFSPWRRVQLAHDKIQKAMRMLAVPRVASGYRHLVTLWLDPPVREGDAFSSLHQAPTPRMAELAEAGQADLMDEMMLTDTLTYLPDDILHKVDRASMAVGLEARVPMLDRRIYEFAWRLPRHMKVQGTTRKWILRELLYQRMPRELFARPKRGFAVPIGEWLRDPLRDWANALLDPARLRREGYLDPVPIGRTWTEHLSGRRNWQHHIWNVLMFQAWLEEWGSQ